MHKTEQTHYRSLLCAAILCVTACCAPLASAAGIHKLQVSDNGQGESLAGAVWTPCASPDAQVQLKSSVVVAGVRDCPMPQGNYGLIIVSHGYLGWFGGHHGTAAALADAGYVVAALSYPHERDKQRPLWRTDRPRVLSRLVDYMLHEWRHRDNIDPTRVGLFGFSRGGYAALVALGSKPNFWHIFDHCANVPDDPICVSPGDKKHINDMSLADRVFVHFAKRFRKPPPYPHDERFKAAVLAAPLSLIFPAEELEKVKAPVQLWRAEFDELVSHPYHVEHVYESLTAAKEYQIVPSAGHFSFLSPCQPPQAQAAPKYCGDSSGFDRTTFHRETFNPSVVRFFDEHLRFIDN